MSEVRTEPKRLADLNPKWVRLHGSGEIWGIRYDCPCGKRGLDGSDVPTHPDVIANVCEMGGWAMVPTKSNWLGEPQCADSIARGWDLTGDSFENVTLTPSIHHVGHWHGFLTNGAMVSC